MHRYRMITLMNTCLLTLLKSEGCCIDSISIKPSSFTNASNILGSREINATRMSGANKARSAANQSYCSTGPFKKGNVSVRASTFEREATNATGNVQKMHNAAVDMRLISCPTLKNKTYTVLLDDSSTEYVVVVVFDLLTIHKKYLLCLLMLALPTFFQLTRSGRGAAKGTISHAPWL